MRINVSATDTWLSVADRYTLSPAYAAAIAEFNGVQDILGYDADGVDLLGPVSVTDTVMKNGLTSIDIPDDWLKRNVQGAASAGGAMTTGATGAGAMTPNQVMIIFGVLLVLALMKGK